MCSWLCYDECGLTFYTWKWRCISALSTVLFYRIALLLLWRILLHLCWQSCRVNSTSLYSWPSLITSSPLRRWSQQQNPLYLETSLKIIRLSFRTVNHHATVLVELSKDRQQKPVFNAQHTTILSQQKNCSPTVTLPFTMFIFYSSQKKISVL